MTTFQESYNQIFFLLSSLTWFGILDLLLVTGSFYLVLSLLRRSSAVYLLREVLILGLLLFIITTLLPLPIFDWLVRGLLVALLVITPIIFQAPLRRVIERLGRVSGLGQSMRQEVAEDILPEIVHVVEDMAGTRTGALIVLEGYDSLEDLVDSGIVVNGRVSAELLGSIFYEGTPLHDGAVIIRTDRVVAAGCVLPLTQQSLQAEKRLGTRHRAAVGLSENYDALSIVVSEEAGSIGVAYQGILDRPLTTLELRERLAEFYDPTLTPSTSLSLWSLIKQVGRSIWHPAALLNPRQQLSNFGLLLISILLTFVVWSFVIEQTDPFKQTRIDNISLRVDNIPPNTRLIPSPPTSISAVVQTTENVLPTLNGRTFQAIAALPESNNPGLYRLPIQVNSGEAQVLVLSMDPAAIDVEVVPVISRTFPINVLISDPESLPLAYQMNGPPTVNPDTIEVLGPASAVEQISQIQATVSVANATTSIRESHPLQALDEQGRQIRDVILQPNQAQINLAIRRKLNAREAKVNAIISGTPPQNYQFTTLTITPTVVTLQGSLDQLTTVGNIVNTSPIDISQATADFTTEAILDLPPDLQVIDSDGALIDTVTVSIRIVPRNGTISLTRPVEILQTSTNLTATITPSEVDLLISGPLPLLNEIKDDPNLIQILVDPTDLRRGQNADLIPNLITPAGIEVQVVPPSVLVTRQ